MYKISIEAEFVGSTSRLFTVAPRTDPDSAFLKSPNTEENRAKGAACLPYVSGISFAARDLDTLFRICYIFIEPYGGWRDGNCTPSCINHISALFLSKSGMCLFPDNAALSSPRKTLLTFSLFRAYNLDCKEVSECERGSGQRGYVLSRVVGSLFVFNSVSPRCLCIV